MEKGNETGPPNHAGGPVLAYTECRARSLDLEIPEVSDSAFADNLRKLNGKCSLDDPLDMVGLWVELRGFKASGLGEGMLIAPCYNPMICGIRSPRRDTLVPRCVP